jgi:hypothetical protein
MWAFKKVFFPINLHTTIASASLLQSQCGLKMAVYLLLIVNENDSAVSRLDLLELSISLSALFYKKK